jgi:cytochrome c oxidase subunit 2
MNGPLDLFHPAGPNAAQIAPLLWGLIWLSILVVVLVLVALGTGLVLRTRKAGNPAQVVTEESRRGLWWIYGATGASTLVLVGLIGWTLTTMVGIATPRRPVAFIVDVSGAQWWWRFNYEAKDGRPGFATANELHIPVGMPVRFRITADDVIHSFWVPALGGKTDAIPGQVNEAWLEADKPGTYRGQCTEYCGQEHSEMALLVTAEPQAQFDAWRAHQAAAAATANGPDQAQFVQSCGRCHAVRGTPAAGTLGPDLTHLMSRSTIAAGMLPNTRGNLAGWIANPDGIKPGTRMPAVPLSGPQLQAVLNYLSTLT